jgi:hypothetical protein
MRPILALSMVSLLAACGASTNPPDEGGDESVATESSAEALSVTSTPGKAVWTKVWRSPNSTDQVTASDVAVDETGDSFALRMFFHPVGGSVDSTGSAMDLSRYSPTGDLEARASVKTDGVALDPTSGHLAAGHGRVVVVANEWDSTIHYPARALVAVSTTSGTSVKTIHLAALDTKWTDDQGNPSETSGLIQIFSVAVDPDGGFAISGMVDGDMDFGSGVLRDPNPGAYDGFVARYDRSGNLKLARRWEANDVRSIGFDAAGSLYATTLRPIDGSSGQWPTIAKLAADGSPVRSFALSCGSSCVLSKIAVAADGALGFMGNYWQSVTIGSQSFTETNPSKYGEPFVGKLSADGSAMYGRVLPGAGNRIVEGLGIDSYGQLVFALRVRGNVTVGSTPYASTIQNEWIGVMAKVSTSTGVFRWSKGYHATVPSDAWTPSLNPTGLAIASGDRIMMTGTFFSQADFGKGMIDGGGTPTAFLTRFYQ